MEIRMQDPPSLPPQAETGYPEARLSDLLMLAFEKACDQRDLEVATHLLDVLDLLAARIPQGVDRAQHDSQKRRLVTNVAAHERVWRLRNDIAVRKPNP